MNPIQSQAPAEGHSAVPARILVVEDERIVAADLAGALTELGYAVPATVATGQEAVRSARDLQPDLVLMDIRLQGAVDGIQAAASIRDECGVPIIYLTAHSDDETLRRAVHTEPVGYLVKPFTPAQLRCAVEIALHRHEISNRLQQRQQWLARALHVMGDAMSDAAPASTTPQTAGADCLSAVGRVFAGWRRGDPADPLTVPLQSDVPGQATLHSAQFNAELQRRVAERIAELEEANRELERFTYDVARDLRAPLQGIDGLSQALIEDYSANLGPEGLRTLKQVRAAAGRMRRVIDDLLLLSIDDLLLLSVVRKSEARKDVVDLSAIAQGVVEQLRRDAPQRNVRVVIEEGIRIEGDAALLRIALENLIGNAWRRTEEVESPRIEFGAIPREDSRVCFVRDNGYGLDMARVNAQFVAFQGLVDSNDPIEEGDSLGLAVVQRVVSKHGGRIWAEGAAGQGSTFYFSL